MLKRLAIIALSILLSLPAARPATAAGVDCWCGTYARTYYGLPSLEGYPDAKSFIVPDANGVTWMSRQGFKPSATPHRGDFIVLWPGYGNAGWTGHIGIVYDYAAWRSGGGWTVRMLSANWGGDPEWAGSHLGCRNVSIVRVAVPASTAGFYFFTPAR